MLSPEDVRSVAEDLGISKPLTDIEVSEALDRYPEEQKQDPTATWDLVIENILSDMGKI